MEIDFIFCCLHFLFLCLDIKCSHYRCHTRFTTSLQPSVWCSVIFLVLRNYLECGALSCQQAGYVRDTVSVIQHAYSALLYIQDTTSCSGAALFMESRKWKKTFRVEDVIYAHHFMQKWVLKRYPKREVTYCCKEETSIYLSMLLKLKGLPRLNKQSGTMLHDPNIL